MKIFSALIFVAILVASGQALLPNANLQCKLLHGRDASFCHDHKADVCSSLACIPNKQESKCIISSFGAAEGTPCDSGKVCKAGKCVADKEISESVRDECLFGDKALLEPELISETLPKDLKLTCENVLMHLLKSGKSPFAACKEPKFRSACCDSCKIFDKIECQDSDPAICLSLANSCDDPKANVYGIPLKKACQRTCGRCEPVKCSKNLCMNGGICKEATEEITKNPIIQFQCICPAGYSGQFCELKDACEPNPCLNNGVCEKSSALSYSCKCAHGYNGTRCESSTSTLIRKARQICTTCGINACLSNPCLNNGNCVQYGNNQYYCDCPYGYVGGNCQQLNGCLFTSCFNGATCTPSTFSPFYTCNCFPGYFGQNCQFSTSGVTLTAATVPSTTRTHGPNCFDQNEVFCAWVVYYNYCTNLIVPCCNRSCNLC